MPQLPVLPLLSHLLHLLPPHLPIRPWVQQLQKGSNQGNLKEESVVAAILSSRMEASYCTTGFFRSKARQTISLSYSCLFTHIGYRRVKTRGNDNVGRSCQMIVPNPEVQ